MPLRQIICFIIGIAIAFAQSARFRQNVYRLPNAQVLATQHKVADHGYPLRVVVGEDDQRAIKYVFLSSEVLQASYPTDSEQLFIDLPSLPLGDWNEAHIHLDKHTGTFNIANTSRKDYLETISYWHPRKMEYLEFTNVETLQQDRLQVVTHPGFDVPVLMKIASFPWEIPSLEREVMIYRLLQGLEITPEFLGHVTEGGRAIGFITEYIRELPSIRSKNLQSCQAALQNLHQRGISHGDAHEGNCLIREDGSPVLIDFELSVESWSPEEFERDLDIMSRCIQANSEPS